MRRNTIVLVSMLLAASACAAMVGLWVSTDVADEEAFVAAALVSFQSEGSDDALGALVAAKVVEEFAALQLFESGLASLFSALIVTDPFVPLRIDVSEQIHAVVLRGEDAPVVVDLAEYRSEILSSVSAISEGLAERIPEGAFTTFVIFDRDELPDPSGAVLVVTALGWLALPSALVLIAFLVLGVRDAVTSFVAIGVALLVAASMTVIIVAISRPSIGGPAPGEPYSVLRRNLFDVLVEPLVQRATVIGVIGVGLVGVALVLRAASRRRPVAHD